MKTSTTLIFLASAACCLASCFSGGLDAPASQSVAPAPAVVMDGEFGAFAKEEAPAEEAKKSDRRYRGGKDKAPGAPPTDLPSPPPEPAEADGAVDDSPGAPATRAWFPETFLFEPRVVTDALGRAELAVRVPDRLTTWRVLGLAHDRAGGQAGAELRFLGTLPAYVDPVLPPFLTVGDEVELPVLVVSTRAEALQRQLRVRLSGAAEGSLDAELELPPGASVLRTLRVRARQAGTAVLEAQLAGADSVRRELPVVPSGRPVDLATSGTLGAARQREITGPADLDPDSAKLRLQVFPGPLALLRSELALAGGRGGLESDGYALLLAGQAPGLLQSLNAEVDADALRRLRLLGTQRVLRHARAPELSAAMALTEAALAHPGVPVLERLAERLAATVARSQRPDGTYGGGQGWTLQRVLVTTAEAHRAVQAAAKLSPGAARQAQRSALRASGALERHLSRVEDPYSAAALLASGLLQGDAIARLRERVRKALAQTDDGARYLEAEPGVQRPDGQRPSRAEATALAALALTDDPEAKDLLPDLGSTLLAAYLPGQGWGDGRSSRLALAALLRLFSDPLPERVRITLSADGKLLSEGELSGARLREVATFEALAPAAAGRHVYTVQAEPAVPGLGFSLSLRSYVPWTEGGAPGLELMITRGKEARVGQALEVTLVAGAPAEAELEVRHSLPAGVQPEAASLDALVNQGRIARYQIEDGAVTLFAGARRPGETFQVSYRVVPGLAGVLHAPASWVRLVKRGDTVSYLPAVVWTVKS